MKYVLTMLTLLVSISANAGWVDSTGTVKNIITYAHTETILVQLSVSGINVAECSNKTTFAISAQMSSEGRARMYSMLLSSQTTGRPVVVAVLDTDGCESWFSTQNVYRRIARIR